jgi:hypothetical protein
MNWLVYVEYGYKSKNGKMNMFKTMIGIYPTIQAARFIVSKIESKLIRQLGIKYLSRGREKIGIEETDRSIYPENQKVEEYVIHNIERS